MATVTLVPRTVYNGSSSYLTITDSSNMLTDTSSTTYGTVQCTRNSTTSYYIYLRNFDWDLVPSGAVVSNITIKVKGYQSNGNTGTIYMYQGTGTQVSACGSGTAFTNSASVITFTNTTISWDTLKNYGTDFGMRINCRRSNRNNANTIYIYGAEIDVTYSSQVSVTGVDIPSTASVDMGDTTTITPTITPSNATNQNVTWSSSNTSVATIDSSGVITGVSVGTAVITVTTVDGGFTDTCTVTVNSVPLTDYILTDTMTVGEEYIIATGNSGSVYMLSNVSAGSRKLDGIATTVTNNIISIPSSTEAKVLFDYELYDQNDPVTSCLSNNGQYLYVDNASGLRMYTSPNNKHWHYRGNPKYLLWLFRGATDGYTDDTTEYKYYLTWDASGDFTDNHVTSPSLEDQTSLPQVYIYKKYTVASDQIFVKSSGAWKEGTEVYKKVSGSWVLQSNYQNVFDLGTNYKMVEV